MARQILSNGDGGLSFRTKLNDMFEEVYEEIITNFGILSMKFISVLDSVNNTVKSDPDNGDYHLVAEGGTYGGVACYINDILVWSETQDEWQRLPYGKSGMSESFTFADGTVDPPGETDPSLITSVTHDLEGVYTSNPKVIIVPKMDWDIYIFSISTTQVVMKPGASGSASALDYDLFIFPE